MVAGIRHAAWTSRALSGMTVRRRPLWPVEPERSKNENQEADEASNDEDSAQSVAFGSRCEKESDPRGQATRDSRSKGDRVFYHATSRHTGRLLLRPLIGMSGRPAPLWMTRAAKPAIVARCRHGAHHRRGSHRDPRVARRAAARVGGSPLQG